MLSKAVLSSGGTGGHIFPALALAEELRLRSPQAHILFLGSRHGPEARLARQAGLEFFGLPVRGFIGRNIRQGAAAGGLLFLSLGQALGILRRFKPEIAVGFGGYAAVAGVMASRLLGIPSLIHEQNSIPGAANRLLGRIAHRICLSFPEAEKWFPQKKCVFTGNPVRRDILALHANRIGQPGKNSGNILVLGGSQGARALNRAILEDLRDFLQVGINLRIQCGQTDWEEVRDQTALFPAERVRVDAFIDDMPQAYAWADLVICRAGATTLAELAAAGLPAILVPLPSAAHNHQLHNAEHLQNIGAARLTEQKNLRPGILFRLAQELMQDDETLRTMSAAALRLASPLAAQSLADEAETLVAEYAKGRKNA